MVTQLQKAFAKSKVLRRGISEVLEDEPGITASTRLFLQGLYCQMFVYWSEPQIKHALLTFLQCYDITDAERQEIKQLLQLSQTALTTEQLQQLHDALI